MRWNTECNLASTKHLSGPNLILEKNWDTFINKVSLCVVENVSPARQSASRKTHQI